MDRPRADAQSFSKVVCETASRLLVKRMTANCMEKPDGTEMNALARNCIIAGEILASRLEDGGFTLRMHRPNSKSQK